VHSQAQGDTGRADPALAAALSGWRQQPGPGSLAQVLAALADARVFVAVTATSTAEQVAPATGLRAESSAAMALVSMVDAGGRRALPLFLDPDGLRRWRPDVRPVPVAGREACQGACDDGADAVVVDPAGAALVVPRAQLDALAQGWLPVAGSSLATRWARGLTDLPDAPDPALVAALARALAGEPVVSARLLQSPHGPVLGVVPARALDPAGLAALAARVTGRLGPQLPAAGLDLTAVPAEGPGRPVPLRRRRPGLRARLGERPTGRDR
jgi:hypothetical protein